MITDAPSGPVTERERIVALDVLRGVAVLGILVMNIQSFSMPGAAYMNPTAYGDLTGANRWVWLVCHVLADQKFMTIFSLMFGAGIVLMTGRNEARTGRSAGVHYRRMGWLVLFGLLHAHLLWYGDILYFYGMCGLIAYPFRKAPPWLLVGLGLGALAIPFALNVLFGLSIPFWSEADVVDLANEWRPPLDLLAAEIGTYRGGWLAQAADRSATAAMFETVFFMIWGMWRVGGLMLIGMALFRWGVLSAQRSARFYLLFGAAGLAVGLPLVLAGVRANEAHGWSVEYSMFLGSQWNYVGSLGVTMGWIALVMLVCRAGARLWMKPLAAAGRMALTNYLMQTILCTTIFYGHGLGYYGALERTEQLAIVLGIWALELTWSPIWLHSFRFGPFEWLWRALTYWRRPRLRRDPAPSAAWG